MLAKLTYRIASSEGGYVASCLEMPVESIGTTPDEAVYALRKALEVQLASVEAVAPPSRPPSVPQIDLAVATEPERDREGPGEP
jgi:hypothetical protein